MSESKPLTAKEAAKILRVCPGTIKRWANKGEIEFIREKNIGGKMGRVLIPEIEIYKRLGL